MDIRDIDAGTPRSSDSSAAPSQNDVRRGEMIYRKLGSTGAEVSVIGIGGFHIGKIDKDLAIRIIRSGLDRGITFLDNSWDYNEGNSEKFMGKALKGGYRQKAFLMTKIDGRTKVEAARQIDESLKRLQTDHVDLLQFHEVIRMEDPDRIFADGGAHEAMLEAKQAGKTRFVGFTGHNDPLVHLRMLEIAEQHGFHFDTVQMPINVMDAHFRSFEHNVLPVLLQKHIAPLGMKSMGDDFILKSGVVKPIECLHYAMSRPVAVVITGIDGLPILDQAFEAVKTYLSFSTSEIHSLLARTQKAALTGKFERFKTTDHFDSTAHNPEWLGQVA